VGVRLLAVFPLFFVIMRGHEYNLRKIFYEKTRNEVKERNWRSILECFPETVLI
jgi:hypothetical protein